MREKINSILPPIKSLGTAIAVTCLLTSQLFAAVAEIGTGTTTNTSGANPAPFSKYYKVNRQQYIWTAAELSTAGMTAGATITEIGFNQSSVNTVGTVANYTISMKNTATSVFSTTSFESSGFTEVFPAASVTPTTGWYMLTLGTSFIWDGTSNLIVQICSGSTLEAYTTNASSYYTSTSANYRANYYRSDTLPTYCTNATGIRSYNRANVRFTYTSDACTNPPTPGTAGITTGINCTGDFSLGLTGASGGSGQTYQWQSSPDGSAWEDVEAATNSTLSTTQVAATYYRCNVTCGATVASTSVLVEMPAVNGGTTASTFASVCSGASFTLSLTGASSITGQTYQWQSSPDGSTWSDISGATSSTRVQTQTSETYYRCNVTCGTTSASTSLNVPMNTAFYDCYCASGATNAGDEEIYSVTVNGDLNAYDCSTVAPGSGSVLNRYSNFRTLGALTTINQGATVPFTVEENECDGATYYAFGTAIWIDYDQNGSFADAGEQVFVESSILGGPRNVTSSFVVPGTATIGTTGMRITVAEGLSGAGLTSCLSYGYGETEDYLITIAGPLASNPPSITHTPLTNTASTSDRTVNADITDIDSDLTTTGGGTPTLWYRVGTSGSFTSVTMTTEGANSPDTKKTNQVATAFSGTLPGQSVGGTVVQYYIGAQDDNGNSATSPAGGSGTTPPGSTAPSIFYSYTILDPPPANDDCAAAAAIDWDNSMTGNTSQATQDASDDQTCASNTSTNKSVWYTFTVPAGETWEVQFNTEGATNYDTAMQLFSGTCGGSLVSIECDDDGGVSPSAGSWIPSTTDGPPPSNPFGPKRSLTSGTYYLMMSGFGTASGAYQLNAYRTYVVDPVTNGGSPIPDGTVSIGSGDGTSFIDLVLSGGGTNPTSIFVEATAGTTPGSFGNGVARTWNLNIVGGTGTASFTLYFLATEMTPGMVIGGLAEVWVRISGVWTSVGTGLIVDEGGGFVSVTVTLPLSAPETNKYVNDLNGINGDVGVGEVGDTPLYVNLASFEAKQENKDIVLRWTTASEVDNKGFIVYGGKKVIDAKDGTERIAYIELGNHKNTASLVGKSSSTLETKYSFVDLREHNNGEEYFYYIADEDKDGTITQHTEFTSKVTYKTNSDEIQTKFASYELKQNHPNPFNPETTIEFTISKTQNVEVSVYNVNGQLVKTLVNKTLEGNAIGTSHQAIWDGTDVSGNIVSSGIYFYQIKAGSFIQTKKATFLK